MQLAAALFAFEVHTLHGQGYRLARTLKADDELTSTQLPVLRWRWWVV